MVRREGDCRRETGSSEPTRPTRRALLGGLLALAAIPHPASADGAVGLTFDRLYAEFGVRGLVFSDLVKAAAGHPVALTGYMAPPLKAEARFFSITNNIPPWQLWEWPANVRWDRMFQSVYQ